MDTLSRYKRQLENTNSRLESELEETKKLMASRDQVSEQACIISTCTCRYIIFLTQNNYFVSKYCTTHLLFCSQKQTNIDTYARSRVCSFTEVSLDDDWQGQSSCKTRERA